MSTRQILDGLIQKDGDNVKLPSSTNVFLNGVQLSTIIGDAGGVVTTNVGVGVIRENPKFTSQNTVATDFNTTYNWGTNSGWAVFASHEQARAHLAFDKLVPTDHSSQWVVNNFDKNNSGSAITPTWISMQYPEQVYIRSFSITCENDGNATEAPREFNIEGSNDGSNWDVLQSYTNQTRWTPLQTSTFENIPSTHPPYFNFRLNVKRVNGLDHLIIVELKLYTQATNTTTTMGTLTVNGIANVNGEAALPEMSNVTFGGIPLSTTISNITATDNSVEITNVEYTDSFICTTTNTSGYMQINCTPSSDILDIMELSKRTTPWFLNNTTPSNPSPWSSTGWSISAVRTSSQSAPWHGIREYELAHWEDSYGDPNGVVSGRWWQVLFPSAIVIDNLSIVGSSVARSNPVGFNLQSSTDGVTFNTVQFFGTNNNVAFSGWQQPGVTRTYNVTNKHTPARYWRLEITRIGYSDGGPNGTPARLCKVNFNTRGVYSLPVFSHIVPLLNDASKFKIVLADLQNSSSVNIVDLNATLPPGYVWRFNIMITKNGRLVCTGIYEFVAGFSAVSKLS